MGDPPRQELSILTRLALPVVLTQIGWMTMGLVDVWMVGRLGKEALASVALGDLWIFGTMIVAMGILFGLDPLVSQAHGARRGERAGLFLQRGVVLALLLSLPLMLLWSWTKPALIGLGQQPDLGAQAQVYAGAQVFSAAPMLVFVALRQYLQGRGIMRAGLWITLFANVVNAVLNWGLIFGHFGFPELGVRGAGIATGITRAFMMGALILWTRAFRLHHGAWIPWSRAALRPSGLLEVLRSGGPVGIQYGLEVWAFQVASLFAGRIGAGPLAAHTIVLKFASLSFMVPYGISIAAATRVGNLIGAGDPRRARRAAWIAIGMGAGGMLCFALVFVLLRHWLPARFSSEPEVLHLAAAVLPIAAAFQLFDGTQVVGGGILRGMGNTLPAALFNLLGYYALAIPFAWWLTFARGWGLEGVWWGLCAGLGAVSALLLLWIARRGPGAGGSRIT
ncbi:MAG: MATE family efflux transporter [Planctomycetota bacterium]